MDAGYARAVWQVLEPLHAVTYFAPESREAARAVGLRGFWMGYFALRAAPLGAVRPGVVEAAFSNFHPAMVRRALPDAWGLASPEAVLRARADSATAALRRVAPSARDAAASVLPLLERVIAAADGAGRPLFAANRDVPVPEDPVGALWQAATSLREHRGDGHVAVLTAEGLDGCAAHVLFAAGEQVPVEVLRDNRGWSAQEWRSAADRLVARHLLTGAGALTPEGRALRAHIEARTDALAVRPYGVLAPDDASRLLRTLEPVTEQVLGSGVIPFPNPMGLPRR
ncbi:SCO6745 family protein [Streptomyces sp. enrichment culture]|uniref:SCO6745 family protein n=1 Tax=Streptomyces sp. enrichment culture TaxID=1795815 RepID=UPI003F57D219